MRKLLPLWLLGGCALAESAPAPAPDSFLLARHTPSSLELPASNRPGGAPAESWRPARLGEPVTNGAAVEYTLEPPFPLKSGPLVNPPAGLVVKRDGKPLSWASVNNKAPAAGTWGVANERIVVRTFPDEALAAEALQIEYPTAFAAERALNLATSGLEREPFSLRAMSQSHVQGDFRHGLFLPAPAAASWDLTVPGGGRLSAQVELIPSALPRGIETDGAELIVEIEVAGRRSAIARYPVLFTRPVPLLVDLGPWAGKKVRLWLRTDPRAQANLDYVFVREPAVYRPKADPTRVVLVMIDTLRADRLGAWGYARRPTSPNLDRLAASAVRFSQARSISSWTLPSTRSALTGAYPERWSERAHVGEILSRRGFLTFAVTANAFLTHGFDMARGWSSYDTAQPDTLGGEQVDRALSVLANHPDRDLFLLLHVRDPHLPYTEPAPWRTMWAPTDPAWVPRQLSKLDIERLRERKDYQSIQPQLSEYLQIRYDQSIRYLDDQLARLFAALDARTTVVVMADHGEEFWDHGGFEHGHTLHDEVIRIPLIVRASGVPPRVVDAPVSTIDVLPTILDLLQVPAEAMDGMSLAAAMRGEATGLAERPQIIGRGLYGPEAWGLVRGTEKWMTGGGKDAAYDLSADPGERASRSDAAGVLRESFRTVFPKVVGGKVVPVWRLHHARPAAQDDVTVVVTRQGGFERAWSPRDFRGALSPYSATVLSSGDEVRITIPKGKVPPPEFMLEPRGGALSGGDATIRVEAGGLASAPSVPVTGAIAPDVTRPFATQTLGKERWLLSWSESPEPGARDEVTAPNSDVEALRSLGYLE